MTTTKLPIKRLLFTNKKHSKVAESALYSRKNKVIVNLNRSGIRRQVVRPAYKRKSLIQDRHNYRGVLNRLSSSGIEYTFNTLPGKITSEPTIPLLSPKIRVLFNDLYHPGMLSHTCRRDRLSSHLRKLNELLTKMSNARKALYRLRLFKKKIYNRLASYKLKKLNYLVRMQLVRKKRPLRRHRKFMRLRKRITRRRFSSTPTYKRLKLFNRYYQNVIANALRSRTLPKKFDSVETAEWLSLQKNSYIWDNSVELNKQLKDLRNNTSYIYHKYKKNRGLTLHQKIMSRFYFKDEKFFLSRTFVHKYKKLPIMYKKNRRLLAFLRYMSVLSDPRCTRVVSKVNNSFLNADYTQRRAGFISKLLQIDSYTSNMNEVGTKNVPTYGKSVVKDTFNIFGDTKTWTSRRSYINERYTWGFNIGSYGVPHNFHYKICARFFFRGYFSFPSYKKLHNYFASFRGRTFGLINFLNLATRRPFLFLLSRTWFTTKYTFQSLYASGNIIWIPSRDNAQYFRKSTFWLSKGPSRNSTSGTYTNGDLFALTPQVYMYNNYKRLLLKVYSKSINNKYFRRVGFNSYKFSNVQKQINRERQALTNSRNIKLKLALLNKHDYSGMFLSKIRKIKNRYVLNALLKNKEYIISAANLATNTNFFKNKVSSIASKDTIIQNIKKLRFNRRSIRYKVKSLLRHRYFKKKRSLGLENLDLFSLPKSRSYLSATAVLVNESRYQARRRKYIAIYKSRAGQFNNLKVLYRTKSRFRRSKSVGWSSRCGLVDYYKGAFIPGAVNRSTIPGFNYKHFLYKNKTLNYSINPYASVQNTKYVYDNKSIFSIKNKNLVFSSFYPSIRSEMLNFLFNFYFSESLLFRHYFSEQPSSVFDSAGWSRLVDAYLLKTNRIYKLVGESKTSDLKKMLVTQYAKTLETPVPTQFDNTNLLDSSMYPLKAYRGGSSDSILCNFTKNTNFTTFYKYTNLFTRIFGRESTNYRSMPNERSNFFTKVLNEFFWRSPHNPVTSSPSHPLSDMTNIESAIYRFGLQPTELSYNNQSNRFIFNSGILYRNKRGFQSDMMRPYVFQNRSWLSSFINLFPSRALNFSIPSYYRGDTTRVFGAQYFSEAGVMHNVSRRGLVNTIRQASTTNCVNLERIRRLYYQRRLPQLKSKKKVSANGKASFFFDDIINPGYRLPHFLKKVHYLVNDYYYSNIIATREFSKFSKQYNIFDPHMNETYAGREPRAFSFEVPFYGLVSEICRVPNKNKLSSLLFKKYFKFNRGRVLLIRGRSALQKSKKTPISCKSLSNYVFDQHNHYLFNRTYRHNYRRIAHDYFLIKNFLQNNKPRSVLTQQTIVRERRYSVAAYITGVWRDYFNKFINYEVSTVSTPVYKQTILPTLGIPQQLYNNKIRTLYFSSSLEYAAATLYRSCNLIKESQWHPFYDKHITSNSLSHKEAVNCKIANVSRGLYIMTKPDKYRESIQLLLSSRNTTFNEYATGLNLYCYLLVIYTYTLVWKYILNLAPENIAYIIIRMFQYLHFLK